MLALISGLGWASYAKASDKGLIADSWGSAAAIATALVKLQSSADHAEEKLTAIIEQQRSPALAGEDRLPDHRVLARLGWARARPH